MAKKTYDDGKSKALKDDAERANVLKKLGTTLEVNCRVTVNSAKNGGHSSLEVTSRGFSDASFLRSVKRYILFLGPNAFVCNAKDGESLIKVTIHDEKLKNISSNFYNSETKNYRKFLETLPAEEFDREKLYDLASGRIPAANDIPVSTEGGNTSDVLPDAQTNSNQSVNLQQLKVDFMFEVASVQKSKHFHNALIDPKENRIEVQCPSPNDVKILMDIEGVKGKFLLKKPDNPNAKKFYVLDRKEKSTEVFEKGKTTTSDEIVVEPKTEVDLLQLQINYVEHLERQNRFVKGRDFFLIKVNEEEKCVTVFCSNYESFVLIRNASQNDYNVSDDSGDRTNLKLKVFSSKVIAEDEETEPTIPAQIGEATPDEIVAPSNSNSNLQTTTEMEEGKEGSKKRGRKPAEALSEEQLKNLTALMCEVQKALKEDAGFKSGKHYINILLNQVQNIVAINCKSNLDALAIAGKLKVLGFDVNPVKEGKKSVWVKGKLSPEKKSDDQSPETTSELGKAILGDNFVLDSENDEKEQEVVKEEKPLFPVNYQINAGVSTDKLFNDFKELLNDYTTRGSEIIRLQERISVAEAKNSTPSEKEMLQMAISLFNFNTAHDNSSIELWLRIKMDDGTEKNIPVTKQKFLEDFYSIFLA